MQKGNSNQEFRPACAVYIEDCEGWWLSACHSSVADTWLVQTVLSQSSICTAHVGPGASPLISSWWDLNASVTHLAAINMSECCKGLTRKFFTFFQFCLKTAKFSLFQCEASVPSIYTEKSLS